MRIEDDILEKFGRRYRYKKITNIAVSYLIVILGVSSFIYGLHLEPHVTIFRYMTVDGTLFTTIGSLAAIIVNHIEIFRNSELTNKIVYYKAVISHSRVGDLYGGHIKSPPLFLRIHSHGRQIRFFCDARAGAHTLNGII